MTTNASLDFHPDSLYKVYSSTAQDSACHRGQGPAGIYGAETSECDSPIALINKTMEWVADNLKDKIDFVIWTGDSARHDSDEENPRKQKEVMDLNSFLVHKMSEVFGKHNGDEEDDDPNNDFVIPIVPTFGNNDIMPHNIMVKGPNAWTRAYTTIWKQFIPEAQIHQFEQGGWFYTEVIPNKLAVFSLNTMYFFTNNAAVDGCAARSEPGYRQMEWLRIQLQFLRERGVKAILTGHVPPTRQDAKTLWDETCWQKYALWLRQYRDVIITSAYGHFNYDHFFLQDFRDIEKHTKDGIAQNYQTPNGEVVAQDDDLHSSVSPNYFMELRQDWKKLPKPPKGMESMSRQGEHPMSENLEPVDDRASFWMTKDILSVFKKSRKDKKKSKLKRKQKKYLKKMGGEYAERFAASFVSASVVPNLLPTLRVFEYNTTGLAASVPEDPVPDPPAVIFDSENVNAQDVDSMRKKRKKYKFKVPEPPSKSSPPGPAYSPQTLSLLRYTQYYANLTYINNDFTAKASDHGEDISAEKWREGKHKGKKPQDKDHTPNPKTFGYQLLYDTRDDEVYQLKDLTMPSLVDLARRIGQFVPEDNDSLGVHAGDEDEDAEFDVEKKQKKKHKKHGKHKHRKENEPWYTFVSRAFVNTMERDDLQEQFGH